jgi:hypothetical protein
MAEKDAAKQDSAVPDFSNGTPPGK